MKLKDIFSNRKFRFGSIATVFTAVFIAMVIALNFAVTVLVDKNPLKIDVTDDALYSFSDDTVEYLGRLEQDITISVLAKEDEFIAYGDETCQMYYQYAGINVISHLPAVNELIHRYSQYSDRIKVEYIDIVADPTFSTKYPNDKLSQGQIIVSSKDTGRHKILNTFDLFYINNEDYTVSLKAESVLTSAIMVTALEDLVKVQYTTGHNESDFSELKGVLEQNAYELSEINLSTAEIDDDTDMLILMAPVVDFSKEELDKIDAFLENGGKFNRNVVYFAAYNRAETPLLDSFLKEWGITVGRTLVVETDSSKYFNYNPFMSVPEYADETLSQKYSKLSISMMLPYCVPLGTVFTETDNRSTEVLLSFTDTAVEMPNDAPEDWKPDSATVKGPFDGAVIGRRTTYDKLTELTSSVTVFGSYLVAASNIISSPLYANAEYLLDVFNTVSENDIDLNIVIKKLDNNAINITSSQATFIGIVFAIVIPLVLVAVGIVIWLRRRNK